MTKIRNLFTKKNKRGFSLVEILAAVIIVAIMAAIGIIMIPKLMEQGRETADIDNMKTAQTLMNTYITQGGEADEMYFDAESGNLVADAKGIEAYGKGSSRDGGTVVDSDKGLEYDVKADYSSSIIVVHYKDDNSKTGLEYNGEITASWTQAE